MKSRPAACVRRCASRFRQACTAASSRQIDSDRILPGFVKLSKRSTGHTIYLLDEPTTGLHFEDIRRLLTVLSRLVDQGNTVLVIEHNLDVIKTADWIIDLGPEGGAGGGTIVATGTPEDVARNGKSHTAEYLRPLLESA